MAEEFTPGSCDPPALVLFDGFATTAMHTIHPAPQTIALLSTLKGRGRFNSNDVAEVAENKTAPPSPKWYISLAPRDFSGLRIKLEPQVFEDPQTHEKTSKPLCLKFRAPPPIGNMSAVMESGQVSVASSERKTSPTVDEAVITSRARGLLVFALSDP